MSIETEISSLTTAIRNLTRRRRCGQHCTPVQEREIAHYLRQGATNSEAAEYFQRCRRTIARIRAKYLSTPITTNQDDNDIL